MRGEWRDSKFIVGGAEMAKVANWDAQGWAVHLYTEAAANPLFCETRADATLWAELLVRSWMTKHGLFIEEVTGG